MGSFLEHKFTPPTDVPEYRFDLALNTWYYATTKYDRHIYERNKELRFSEFLFANSDFEPFINQDLLEVTQGELPVVTAAGLVRRARPDSVTNLGVILEVVFDSVFSHGYWFVQRNGEVLLIPGAVNRKPVSVLKRDGESS